MLCLVLCLSSQHSHSGGTGKVVEVKTQKAMEVAEASAWPRSPSPHSSVALISLSRYVKRIARLSSIRRCLGLGCPASARAGHSRVPSGFRPAAGSSGEDAVC